MRALSRSADSSRAGCQRRSARVATHAHKAANRRTTALPRDWTVTAHWASAPHFSVVLFWTHAIKDSASLCSYTLTKCKPAPRQCKISHAQVPSCQVFCSSARHLGRKPAVRARFCTFGNVPCANLDGPPRRPGAWCPDATQADGCTCYGLLCTETVRSGTSTNSALASVASRVPRCASDEA